MSVGGTVYCISLQVTSYFSTKTSRDAWPWPFYCKCGKLLEICCACHFVKNYMKQNENKPFDFKNALVQLMTVSWLFIGNYAVLHIFILFYRMSRLEQLQTLNTSFNSFPTLPPVVCELRSLNELNISMCRLSELPTQ